MAMGKVRAMTRLDIRARLLRAMLPAALLLLTACNGAQQRVDDANRAYEAGDWDKAWNEATVAQREAQPPLKQRAAFIAGLAAYRQERFDEARARFIVAEGSTDPETSGNAKVMLGDLLTRDLKPAAAAAKYDEAAGLLAGDAASRARKLADAARESAKAPAATPTKVASAETEPEPDPEPATAGKSRARPASKPKPSGSDSSKSGSGRGASSAKTSSKGGFTIQCGAYVKESDARARAKDLADEARRAGLPAPSVKRVTGRTGKKLWIVSVGSFKSRAEGKKALAKLKVQHAEVLPIDD